MKLKFANALSLALIMAMFFTSIGLADTITPDADTVTLGDQTSRNLGTVTSGATLTPTVSFKLVCNGQKHVDNGQTVNLTFTLSGSTVPAGGSLTATNGSIGAIPPAWPDDPATGNGDPCPASPPVLGDNGDSNVTITAPTAPGTYTYVVKYNVGISPAGNQDSSSITGAAPTATFILTVPTPPSNTAPSISLTGVAHGSSYNKGSVPVAMCDVTDAEDNPSDFTATLSTISGPYASDGIGSQTANCSYTDAGGLTASASATYSIVDSSAPSISYAVTAATPDGNNGWYKSNVTLTWTVSEPDSPSSLSTTGCADQNITADQDATTYSCSASSAGGSAGPVSVSIKRDATAPVITFDGPSTASWYNTDVTANWSCSDALSGAVSDSVNATSTGEGSAVLATGICTDNAGNTTSDTKSFQVDKTGPSITASATKADSSTYSADTWTNQDVTVDFTCEDAGSGVASCLGDATYNTEDTFTASGTATDNAGNTSNTSFGPIKIDKTAPTISGAPTTPPNSNGWYNGDVTIHWTCSDALSGLNGSCPADSVIDGEGNNLSASASVSDLAGNSASATVSGIKIDRTAPAASASASPAANSNGWNNTNVTVTFSGNDGSGSGIDFCDAPAVLSADGAAQSASGTCTDKAGNVSALASATGIKIDKTAPTASATASPAPNANGWNNTDVTVSFNGSDALSGIASCSTAVVLSSEGAGQSASGTCTDQAGNVSVPASATASIDKTAPTVSLVGGPANGGSYYFGAVPAAPTCSASDALSGLDGSCLVSGYSNSVGTHTVSTSATDKAGNSAGASASYTVLAWTLRGFYQPVDMNGVVNTVKGGSTVPLKFEAFAGPTELTDTAIVSTLVKQVTCNATSEDTIEVLATGGTSLRYDSTSGQFIFNWQTPRLPGKCYSVTLTIQDGSSITALFKLK